MALVTDEADDILVGNARDDVMSLLYLYYTTGNKAILQFSYKLQDPSYLISHLHVAVLLSLLS